jgi:hypothetical protein
MKIRVKFEKLHVRINFKFTTNTKYWISEQWL